MAPSAILYTLPRFNSRVAPPPYHLLHSFCWNVSEVAWPNWARIYPKFQNKSIKRQLEIFADSFEPGNFEIRKSMLRFKNTNFHLQNKRISSWSQTLYSLFIYLIPLPLFFYIHQLNFSQKCPFAWSELEKYLRPSEGPSQNLLSLSLTSKPSAHFSLLVINSKSLQLSPIDCVIYVVPGFFSTAAKAHLGILSFLHFLVFFNFFLNFQNPLRPEEWGYVPVKSAMTYGLILLTFHIFLVSVNITQLRVETSIYLYVLTILWNIQKKKQWKKVFSESRMAKSAP